MEENNTRILKFHTQVLKYLLLWPLNCLNKKQNFYLRYGVFYYGLCCSIPVFSAGIYQFSVGIDDFKVLLEALVGIGDITGYILAYICFLTRHDEIEALIIDFEQFIRFGGLKAMEEIEEVSSKYTKYSLIYVTIALVSNFIWQMMSTKSCIEQRGTEFYVTHDPCWMPVRNLYPFDANQPKLFWIFFPIEAIYSYHICCFFTLATATIIGFLMHISAQLQCCAKKFERVFDKVDENEYSQAKAQYEFLHLIKYYQNIIKYSQKVFQTFNSLIGVYISMTSILISVICYQVVNPKINAQDRIKYVLLLNAWCLLVYMICFYGQIVQDEAVKVGQAIFKSKWYKFGVAVKIRKYITFTLARTQKPLEFKAQFLGSISLMQFMRVMKWAYSILTLLLTVTDDK